jgi:hypothetical protein
MTGNADPTGEAVLVPGRLSGLDGWNRPLSSTPEGFILKNFVWHCSPAIPNKQRLQRRQEA